MTSDLHQRVTRLSLEDKVRLLTGRTGWVLHAATEIGLLPITVSDGPAGVRGTETTRDEHSAGLPSPTAVAAAWDTELMERVGRFFAAEARRKDVDVVLAPVLNLHRSPAGGRHFECFSEDPHLTAELGAAFVRAVQGEGVGTCPKHFIGNETEHERTGYVSRIDERTLREVYLPPFEAVLDAGAWTVMAAYNGVDDGAESSTMTEHHRLLTDLLKGELGFDGVVFSDWAATRSTAPSADAGLDIVMPGPDGPWGRALVDAVHAGEVDESVIDEKVVRLLRLAGRVGKLDRDTTSAVAGEDEHVILREIGSRGHVLLRNEGDVLPLSDSVRTVALIGPNAVDAYTQGGGSAHVNAEYLVDPAQGLREVLPEHVEVTLVRGGDPRRLLPVVSAEHLTEADLTLYDGHGEAIDTPEVPGGAFHIEARESAERAALVATLTLHEPGTHRIEVAAVGAHTIRIDDEIVSESDQRASVDDILESRHAHPEGPRVEIEVPEDTEPRTVRVDVDMEVGDFGGFGRGVIVQIRHAPPGPTVEEEIQEAVRAAEAADVAIVVVGTNNEVESEGYDRPTLALPGGQDELVRRVYAANPNTAVVVNAGAPVLLPWLDEVPAVLWSWFGGQEYGHALADTLTGRAEPTGRLPWTLPRDHDDVPIMDTHPVDGVHDYAEGVFVGHRAYDRDGIEPHRPFGFGLGYTDWRIDGAVLSAPHTTTGADGLVTEPPTVTVTVTNTGRRPGHHVVQVYLEPPADEDGLPRPLRSLAAFASVHAAPGETVTVPLHVPTRALAIWDPAEHARRTPEGVYHLAVGSSSRAIAHRPPFEVR
ncbi:MAG TPA: glycoside hydrolase family 3 C-terminal domain-containing protein [Nocardiopsis listeri]|uniref:beta-glucosidase n=1 Tax=Nocardiopsis listeri TaxID=53440 RepID=UPI001E0DD36A|nr:glycoside hydrolase family 3 C-terminal domain-containing protein [Nocardiopsis listeri]HJE58869.1 glycoside hydrolase family 3 C-terminal domain-containing protein [Nocardiopsis listeri]